MEPQVNRNSTRTSELDPPIAEPVRVVEQTTVAPGAPVYAETPVVQRVEAAHAVERVDAYSSISPHAVAAGLLAIAMLVWGGVAMARAGFDGDFQDPTVDVFGMSGNAVSGIAVAAIGIVLLLTAIARERGPIVFVTVVAGVAALILAFEPDAGDGALGVESNLPVLIAIGCGVVLALALIVPTFNRRTQTIERA